MKKTGFTLIEFLVIVAIIGIVVALLSPLFAGISRDNKIEATIIEKIENEDEKLIVYKLKDGEKRFASVKSSTEGWGIFISLKEGGKYLIQIKKYGDGNVIIYKILKVISEPVTAKEDYDPYKALTNMREEAK